MSLFMRLSPSAAKLTLFIAMRNETWNFSWELLFPSSFRYEPQQSSIFTLQLMVELSIFIMNKLYIALGK